MKTGNSGNRILYLKSVTGILFCLFALTSNAQYAKLTKGQPVPFDTAVAIRIDVYRIETKKLRYGQQLVDSLLQEIKSLHWESKLADSLTVLDRFTIAAQASTIQRKDSVNHLFKQDFDRLYGLVKPEKVWYKKPEVLLWALLLTEIIRISISAF